MERRRLIMIAIFLHTWCIMVADHLRDSWSTSSTTMMVQWPFSICNHGQQTRRSSPNDVQLYTTSQTLPRSLVMSSWIGTNPSLLSSTSRTPTSLTNISRPHSRIYPELTHEYVPNALTNAGVLDRAAADVERAVYFGEFVGLLQNVGGWLWKVSTTGVGNVGSAMI